MENLSKMKNNNYPNWLVPLYIAKELREIGFREKTFTYFEINTDGEDRYFTPTDINFKELQIYNSMFLFPLGRKSLLGLRNIITT